MPISGEDHSLVFRVAILILAQWPFRVGYSLTLLILGSGFVSFS